MFRQRKIQTLIKYFEQSVEEEKRIEKTEDFIEQKQIKLAYLLLVRIRKTRKLSKYQDVTVHKNIMRELILKLHYWLRREIQQIDLIEDHFKHDELKLKFLRQYVNVTQQKKIVKEEIQIPKKWHRAIEHELLGHGFSSLNLILKKIEKNQFRRAAMHANFLMVALKNKERDMKVLRGKTGIPGLKGFTPWDKKLGLG